jgi:hypothetical protein
MFASSSWDKTIKIFDFNTHQELDHFIGHTDYVQTIVFVN